MIKLKQYIKVKLVPFPISTYFIFNYNFHLMITTIIMNNIIIMVILINMPIIVNYIFLYCQLMINLSPINICCCFCVLDSCFVLCHDTITNILQIYNNIFAKYF